MLSNVCGSRDEGSIHGGCADMSPPIPVLSCDNKSNLLQRDRKGRVYAHSLRSRVLLLQVQVLQLSPFDVTHTTHMHHTQSESGSTHTHRKLGPTLTVQLTQCTTYIGIYTGSTDDIGKVQLTLCKFVSCTVQYSVVC